MKGAVPGFAILVLLMGIAAPASASVEDGYAYLEKDSMGRFLPIFYESGRPVILANIDSITAPALSPDGSRVAFTGAIDDESLGRYAIFIVNVDGSGLTQVTTGGSGELDPSWSPDGNFIVFSLNDTSSFISSTCCRLMRVNISTGQVIILTAHIGAVRPTYSPQGGLIAFDTPVGVWTMPATGGTAALRAASGSEATFSPGGSSLAYLSNSGSNRVLRSLNLITGSTLTIYSTANSLESPIWSGDRIYFLEHAGSGYDGRTGVSLKSVHRSGSDVQTELSYSGVVVGLSLASGQNPAHLIGRFDSDALTDLGVTGPLTRKVLRSSGTDFQEETWGDLSPSVGWSTHLAGDFNGDNRDDTASYRPGDGTWHISISSGSDFATSLWADYSTNTGWTSQLVGDFDGDGTADIASYHPGNGTWWVSRSTGSGFTTTLWAAP